MASHKDILEAQRYNRRRLVTAFTSGTPGGRELEATSHFGPLLLGIIVVIVMALIAAVMGRFAPVLPRDWHNSTLIVVKNSGARYFTIDAVLRPVTNITSARLLAQKGKYQTSEVESSVIAGLPRGTQVGITGLPDDIPAAQQLHSTTWFSCALADSTHTWVGQLPTERTGYPVALVRNLDNLYLVSGQLRHPIPQDQAGLVLVALDLETTSAVEVSAAWLGLFAEGSPLQPLHVSGAGQPVSGLPEHLGAALGSVLRIEDGNSRRHYVVTGPGTIASLSKTAEELYAETSQAIPAKEEDIAALQITSEGFAPADWPISVERPLPSDARPCARLGPGTDEQLVATLSAIPAQTAPDATARSATGDLGTTVAGGSGALVRASGTGLASAMLVSDLGTGHGFDLEDPQGTLTQLGYRTEDIAELPAAWLQLIPTGATLSIREAWETVEQS